MSAEPRYIAVDSIPVTIIRRCTDRACDKYHQWVKFDTQVHYSEAAQIAKAMNTTAPPIPASTPEKESN